MNQSILVTGGAGFIGSNLTDRLLAEGHSVTVLDSLARPGSIRNLQWLRGKWSGGALEFVEADIRDREAVARAVEGKASIFHFAAQVAVTFSVEDPRTDFEVNAGGTLNVLEAARASGGRPLVVLTSTNKVYGSTGDLQIEEKETRYAYAGDFTGISETRPLDFHSPYGCSKGAADQYVRDYFRIYDLPTVVFRMSCIYGTHQYGTEDQGWVAHLVNASLHGRPITIYGDGKQVRDLLWIDDLLDAFCSVLVRREDVAGEIFNIGGGPRNTISVWAECGPVLQELLGRDIPVQYSDWRPGDQKIYVSNTAKGRDRLDWEPKVTVQEGVSRLVAWLSDQVDEIGNIQ